MTIPTDTAASADAQTFAAPNPPATLCLRFRGGQHDGQSARISSKKCTIGSASQATLRLACKGVHPIHCVILSGSEATAIRRLSPDTLLNGSEFEDEKLCAGDVLSIGPLQLEVVETACGRQQSKQFTQSLADDRGQPAGQEQLTALEQQLQAEQHNNQQLKLQLEQITSQWEAARAEADLAAAQQPLLAAENAAELERLVSETAALTREKEELASQVVGLQEQLEVSQAAQSRHSEELSSAIEKIGTLEASLEEQERLVQEVEQLKSALERTEALQQSWEEQRMSLEQELEKEREINAELGDQLQTLHQQDANPDVAQDDAGYDQATGYEAPTEYETPAGYQAPNYYQDPNAIEEDSPGANFEDPAGYEQAATQPEFDAAASTELPYEEPTNYEDAAPVQYDEQTPENTCIQIRSILRKLMPTRIRRQNIRSTSNRTWSWTSNMG